MLLLFSCSSYCTYQVSFLFAVAAAAAAAAHIIPVEFITDILFYAMLRYAIFRAISKPILLSEVLRDHSSMGTITSSAIIASN
jgi:hypothetical protein